MHVLVYFDENQQNVAYDTVALLCKQFVVELDLLVTDGATDVADWQALTPAPVREVRGSGPLALRVAALSAQRQYDLVVAALADHGGLLRLLLRSRVGQLVHSAPATIWVARGQPRALRRIVVGLSGGPQTEQDVRLAILLAKTFGAMITLVHVVSQLPLIFVTPDEYWASMRYNGLSVMDPAVAAVVKAEELVRAAGVPVKVDVRAGIVLDELRAACAGGAGVSPADLLVVGAHRLTPAPGSPYLEDLAEMVTQAVRVPTLVIHATSDWQVWNSARLARTAVA
jgi:nucleotide-binding universal stress UspA family protein